MPDCHSGTGCVIGFTADLGGKIIPNIVGDAAAAVGVAKSEGELNTVGVKK